jgi:hypothetical protein
MLQPDVDPHAVPVLDEFGRKDTLAIAAGRLDHHDLVAIAALTQPLAADVIRR